MAENKGVRDEEKGTKRSIYAALVANALIAVSKFVAGFITGSSSLLAEGAHSVADTINQVFLRISLPLSRSGPDREHPFGHGKDRFFWSLLVAVGLFVAGAVFSIYEGVTAITGESERNESYLIAYVVLGAAFVFEAGALVVSSREFGRAAREENRSFWEHFKVTRNTTMKVPLYEDAAALVGLVIAGAGLLLTQLTGNRVFDGLGAIGVGLVLGFVAFELGRDSRALLLGEAVPPEDEEQLREIITSFDEVSDILRLLTMHLGPNAVLVNAEIHVVDGLDTDQIEELLERITGVMREEVPEVVETFIELHPPGRKGQPEPRSDG
jgi:cation diffusion facilitator family transporter